MGILRLARTAARMAGLLLALALFFGPAAARAAAAGGDVTVLIYHRFDDQRYPSTSVSLTRFREQMQWLADNGYRVVPLAEVSDALAAGRGLPERAVAITIDDAYRSVYDVAWPVLKEYGYPFTLFVYVKAVERGYGDFMTWDQVRELAAAGAGIGSHGYGHGKLTSPPPGLSRKQYRQWIAADLKRSRKLIRKRLGFFPRFYAIPYGLYNDVVLETAAAAGFDAVFTQDPGSVGRATGRFMIPREPILGRDWSTIGHFAAVIRRRDLPLASYFPHPGPVAAPLCFDAAVMNPAAFRKGDFELYLSELGWRRVEMKDGRIHYEFPGPFTRRFNRVMVKGRLRDGTVALRSWLIGPARTAP